ncbi:hypothetical protein BD410DRAFT_792322, partial [Rickenella mellea]
CTAPTQLWLAPEIFTTSSHNVLATAWLGPLTDLHAVILWPLTRANPILFMKALNAVNKHKISMTYL